MKQVRVFRNYLMCSGILALLLTGCGSGTSGGSTAGSGSSSLQAPPRAVSVTLAWDAPTHNTDGTALTDLTGYRVYYGISSGNYTESVDLGNITETTIRDLAPGQWCFSTTAYNSSGSESFFSDEVCANI